MEGRGVAPIRQRNWYYKLDSSIPGAKTGYTVQFRRFCGLRKAHCRRLKRREIMPISKRSNVEPFLAMDVMDKALTRIAAGQDIARMEVGQPGTPAPGLARQEAARIIKDHAAGYTPALGIPELRARIARLYGERYDLDLNPSRVVVTSGSSGGFILSFLTLFDAGAKVALGTPYYPAYPNTLKALDLEPVLIETDASTHYQISPELLASEGEIEGFIVASPANPTGAMFSPEELKSLAGYAEDNDLRMISDEIYHGITFGRPEASALSFSDEAIAVNSFSKYYSMPGWRIGWLVVPEDLVRPMECLAQNLFISAQAISQFAGVAAMDANDELAKNVAVYRQNRDYLLEEFPKIGITRMAPADGAFYIYADISDFSDDSRAFCEAMLEECHVAATPGHDFDPARGHRMVRFSYAGTHETIQKAVHRLGAWLEGMKT